MKEWKKEDKNTKKTKTKTKTIEFNSI